MSDEQQDYVVCMRFDDAGAGLHTPSYIRVCTICEASVWFSESSPAGAEAICELCATGIDNAEVIITPEQRYVLRREGFSDEIIDRVLAEYQRKMRGEAMPLHEIDDCPVAEVLPGDIWIQGDDEVLVRVTENDEHETIGPMVRVYGRIVKGWGSGRQERTWLFPLSQTLHVRRPQMHKAEPQDPVLGVSTCRHCGASVRQVPSGGGRTWVHTETGMVVGSGLART